jgi:cell volume regulation protein A
MSINALILAAALLLLLGIASSKFAARLGMPVLVLFLGVGMLAGSEGLARTRLRTMPSPTAWGAWRWR